MLRPLLPVGQVSLGWAHVLVLTQDGRLFGWGCNRHGQLGLDDEALVVSSPRMFHTSVSTGPIQAVATASAHTLALSKDGRVWVCGRNTHGLLGLGQDKTCPSANANDSGSPVVEASTDVGNEVTTGVSAAHATKKRPRLCLPPPTQQTTSPNDAHPSGKTLREKPNRHSPRSPDKQGVGEGEVVRQPQLVQGLPCKVTKVACATTHSVCVLEDGRIATWGLGQYGALGLGNAQSQWSPKVLQVGGQGPAVHVVDVACGLQHTVAADAMGGVYAWGLNSHGQLGTGKAGGAAFTPQYVELPANLDIVQICCGSRHTLALTDTGVVLAWGDNQYGQCGPPTDKHTGAAQVPRKPPQASGQRHSAQQPTSDPGERLVLPIVHLVEFGTKTTHIAAGLWHSVCVS